MDDEEAVLLTTADNPFSPFTQFDEWYDFDTSKGYNTCAYIARLCKTSDDLPEEEQDMDVRIAMEQILKLNLTGNYKIVTKKDFN